MGYNLLNYRWVFSAGRFLQSAVASGTSNSQLGGSVIRTFQLPPPDIPHVWNEASEPQLRKVELWARKLPRILPKVATSTSILGSFTCRKFTTWDRRLYFPSEGRRADHFLARKIRRLRSDLKPRTRVPMASTLTSRPPKPLHHILECILLGIHIFLDLINGRKLQHTKIFKPSFEERKSRKSPWGMRWTVARNGVSVVWIRTFLKASTQRVNVMYSCLHAELHLFIVEHITWQIRPQDCLLIATDIQN